MTISVVDMFSIGIGPSSSHTVGPMRAAATFIRELGSFPDHVDVTLRGSLASTGRGHGTDRAVLLGLVGWDPTTVPTDVDSVPELGVRIPDEGSVTGPSGTVSYRITWDPTPVPEHPNCVVFSADGTTAEYFSVGGGFIRTRAELNTPAAGNAGDVPLPFTTAAELLAHCARENLSFAEVTAANEAALHGDIGRVEAHLDAVWDAMRACVTAGIATPGLLPGGLGVIRRAPGLYAQLTDPDSGPRKGRDGLTAMDWVSLYALAVNEENAAGRKVVTAPTNGAAGIVPAVMHYARDYLADFTRQRAREFLLTAGAVGIIIKENASISGAEVGCQGEVGSASAMAAAGLCALIGGSPAQVENAAEIALEHNLGLTCDPVGGLVQIPCIERNAIGAVKAINAARLARLGTGLHRVTLDEAVQTMAETGRDMMTKYKETSTGGLAVNLGLPVSIPEC
ncbi:L-serine ammonia-lyase [Corynebacterium comes]|uniref:L-serine dehydratase n=1 Tax=Corynebacterium comes TaxID=2675218 RepID=A0A6B8VTM2_9CORY|nr:L-serine ammonia-lyase [Corynebacterium comes]QGU04724.1 L-serine dehydratase 2 [Corynebacterium comes]